MKYIDIIKAFAPMQQLKTLKLPIKENKKSLEIYKMILEMGEIVEFIRNEELKIVGKYKGIVSENGSIVFSPNTDDAQKCSAEIYELENSEADWEHGCIVLAEESLVDAGGFALSPEEIYALEKFISFE